MLKEIYDRQSIRKYEKKEVEQEKLEEILRAGMQAPSARNTQSWRFLVIRNRQALDNMIQLQPYTGMMKEAPCAILVLADIHTIEPHEYLYVNASAAIENMLIEAVHQGLGTCWCAVGPQQERIDNFCTYFHLESHLLPVGVIALGYARENKEKVDRYDPQKVSYFN